MRVNVSLLVRELRERALDLLRVGQHGEDR